MSHRVTRNLRVACSISRCCHARPLQYQSFVTKLGDEDFEHATQASSGQTTGSWLVYFYGTGERIVIQGKQPPNEYWDEKHVVVGIVNALVHHETVERFNMQSKVPGLIYIHRGKYYEFDGDKTWERVVQMIEDPNAMFPARNVPPPPSELQKMIKKLKGPAGLPFLVIGFFLVFVRVLYWVFVEPHQVKRKKN
ncbi:hypothetical protein MPSEU_000067200 [Mayamaea pseudoterrestris]|nr:hypothetical protein MPSEU_000067200 [Mayamaea pseudoterrestris]